MNRWIIAAAVGALAAVPALADQHMPREAMSPGERMMDGDGRPMGQGAGNGPGAGMPMHSAPSAHRQEVQREQQFRLTDRDGDGFISRDEARAHSRLEENWEEADTNRDGRLDQSEFSAYESLHPGGRMR